MASRFSDHKISAASDDTSEGYSPYTDINSENDASLSRFADCVTELEEWIEYARNKETVELGVGFNLHDAQQVASDDESARWNERGNDYFPERFEFS